MSAGWDPEGFDDYRHLFPATGENVAAVDRRLGETFLATWRQGEGSPGLAALRRRAAETTVVCVRGFLGNYLPGNLVAAARALRRSGFDVRIARNDSGATVETNVARIAAELSSATTRPRLIFCGHSRGGVECLALLAAHDELARRCDGVAGAQMPYGPSPVLASLLAAPPRPSTGLRRRSADAAQRLGLAFMGARSGAAELAHEGWSRRSAALAAHSWPFPVAQVATWSLEPRSWLDSFHRRLGEIGPGRAHDGQFFLDRQIWPGLRHVLLPRLDHAQPALGGGGFDAGRFWVVLLASLLAPP